MKSGIKKQHNPNFLTNDNKGSKHGKLLNLLFLRNISAKSTLFEQFCRRLKCEKVTEPQMSRDTKNS
jgi:hypothetical protein